ncbi:MAG: hypothetical protein A3F40_05160 [Chlamydiae bacterium RIFCSPHIGHO2_12_FULL_27_8]|nr:MAG: hypothetical protein A3F40_05160 [Chlamydiae bacterium RIFCSPHIGHO2_12_FULL_27_8]
MKPYLKKLEDGNYVPMIGLGTWQLTDEKCINSVKEAIKIGYTLIDTAEIYGNLDEIAKAIKGVKREKLFITSKIYKDHLNPKIVESRVDENLNRLKTDYLDLYLIHWPDRTKPMNDVLYEMLKQKEKGKIKSIGVSNFTINHINDILKQGLKIEVNQVEYHPFLNQAELLNFCRKNFISIEAYCPLARGNILHDPIIKSFSIKYNKTSAQISLKWLIQKDIIAIPSASSKEHLKENFDIFDFEISLEDCKKIDEISFLRPKRIITGDFADFEY